MSPPTARLRGPSANQGVEGLPRDGVVGNGTGGWLLLHGDTYYVHRNYCYKYVPSAF
ncbi:hypothetical protein [Streptomyces mirabilis]|uniref:hypothetical protein n=1 Tax=Streptomyces mirabilis TaxID=68239 RepID=UPI0036F0E80E